MDVLNALDALVVRWMGAPTASATSLSRRRSRLRRARPLTPDTGEETGGEGFTEGDDTADVTAMTAPMLQPADPTSVYGPGGPGVPSPWADPTYMGFRDILRGTAPALPGDAAGAGAGGGGTTYQQLMAQESRVLDTVDRVVNDARYVEARDAQFWELPLSVVLNRTARTVLDVFEGLMHVRSPRDAMAVVQQDGRPLYLGIALLIVTLIICLGGARSPL